MNILFGLAVVVYNLQLVSAQTECTLGPFGLICLQKYKSVDWKAFADVAKVAGMPTNMVQWTDSERTKWIAQLKQACAPFNEVGDCTAKQGGRRWWRCMDDDQIQSLLAEMPPPAGSGDDGGFPTQAGELRSQFEALQDLCDPQLSEAFNRDQPCMKTAFAVTTPDITAFKTKLSDTDLAAKNQCGAFTCSASKVYHNLFVYVVNAKCERTPAETAGKLTSCFLRLAMMNSKSAKTYCSTEDYPIDIDAGNYLVKPASGMNPVDMMIKLPCKTAPAGPPAPPPPPPGIVTLPPPTTAPDSAPPSPVEVPPPPPVVAPVPVPVPAPRPGNTAPLQTIPRAPPMTTTKRRQDSGVKATTFAPDEYMDDNVDEDGFNVLPRVLKDYDLEFLDISSKGATRFVFSLGALGLSALFSIAVLI